MYLVLINPTAGSNSAGAAGQAICRLLKERSIPCHAELPDSAEHVTELARTAALSGYSAIVGVGGDGTLSAIAAGLVEHPLPLYFAPCGTGNDFVRMLRLPADPVEAVAAQLDGTDSRLDMATVNGKGFLNVAGTGFDVEVLREVTRFKHVGKGLVPYLLGLVHALKKFRAFQAELTLDTGEVLNESFTILSFANGRYFGGGMKVAPRSELADGLLDVMIIRGLPKFAVPFLLPLFIFGIHARLPFICRIRRCQKIFLRRPGMTFNIDGELFDMDEAEVKILPGHLPVRLPAAPASKKATKEAA